MTQPEALRLADDLNKAITLYSAALENSDIHMDLMAKTAAELRRLHAQRDALLEACRMAMMLRQLGGMLPGSREVVEEIVKAASAAIAIAKAEGQQ